MTNGFRADSALLCREIELNHGGNAQVIQSVPVLASTAGQEKTLLVVHVFRLSNHPTSTRAYAWFLSEGPNRRCSTTLHSRWVNSPAEAVRMTSNAPASANDR